VQAITARIERILDRLGIHSETDVPSPPAGGAANTPAPGAGLAASLPEVTRTIQALTGLFTAASAGPDEAARQVGRPPQTLGGQQWLSVLQSVQAVLAGISHVVDGLILLVPILIGALAWLITRLDDLKLAVVDLLQFALRNVFLLRGVVLVTIYDTVSAIASLAASLLGIISTMIERVLASIFRIIGELLGVAIEAMRFLANGIQRTVDALLSWLLGTLFVILNGLGDTLIFRVIVHVIRTIPAILPPLILLIRDRTLGPTELADLRTAGARPISFAAPAAPAPLPPFPNLGDTLTPVTDVTALVTRITTASGNITTQITNVLGAAQDALRQMAASLNLAAEEGESGFTAGLNVHLGVVQQRARSFADALTSARQAAVERPENGMEAIAQAYEGWLNAGGLNTILSNITEHFQHAPELPRQVIGAAGAEIPRATVEIQDVIIEIAPPTPGPATPQVIPVANHSNLTDLLEEWYDLEQRGYLPGQGLPLSYA
jgi:hypothetical protein